MRFALLLLLFPVMSSAATLFYLEPKGEECEARELSFPSLKEKVVFKTKGCPEQISWTKKKDRIYYALDGRLWAQSLPSGKPEDITALPAEDVSELWIDRATGRVRATYLVEVKETDVAEKDGPKGKKPYYKFEGKEYYAGDRVSWGLPYMAIAVEWKSGKWNRLEAQATKSDAGDTEGTDVLMASAKRKDAGRSHANLLLDTICIGAKLNCQIEEDKTLKNLLGEAEGYGLVKSAGNLFAFVVTYGDTPHASAPVFFCEKNCAKGGRKLEEITGEQLSLGASGAWLMVAEEYSNSKPYIYDGKSGKLLKHLPAARGAVWLD